MYLSSLLSLTLPVGETVAHNRVDKFIDVLLTKGPKAIGIFHESLGKTYPGVFDYLTRLFASTGIDLPETRRSKNVLLFSINLCLLLSEACQYHRSSVR